MKTKWMNFFILWGLLVAVQGFAITVMDFSSNLITMLVAAIGTALTLFLGLKVERERVVREVHSKEADIRSDEVRRIQEIMFSNKDQLLVDAEMYDYPVKHPQTPLFIDAGQYTDDWVNVPQPSAHLVVDGEEVYKPEGFMPPNWKDIADADDEEMSPKPEPDICKHCYRQINGSVHAEGMAKGRMRCDPEDTLGGYGYNAEPSDAECGPTCLGHE